MQPSGINPEDVDAVAPTVDEPFSPPKTHDPIGTYRDLIDNGLSPNRYRSCSVPTHSNRGCAYLAARTKTPCQFAYKGKGPHNHGVMIRSRNGSSNVFACPCYHFMALVGNHRMNGETFEVVANEGEFIYEKGTEEVVEEMPGGKKRVVVKQRLFKIQVPAFPRPHENPLLAEEIGTRKLLELVAERQGLRRIAQGVGVAVQEEKMTLGGIPAPIEAAHIPVAGPSPAVEPKVPKK